MIGSDHVCECGSDFDGDVVMDSWDLIQFAEDFTRPDICPVCPPTDPWCDYPE